MLLCSSGTLNAQTLHPRVARWRETYQRQGLQAFFDQVQSEQPLNERDAQVRAAVPRTRSPRSFPSAIVLDERFFQRLSGLHAPHPLADPDIRQRGGGGGDAPVLAPPLDFRGSNFLAPWAQMPWHVLNVPPAMIPTRIKQIELAASQLAQQGVNVVRLFLSWPSWCWWKKVHSSPASFKLFLLEIVRRFARYDIRVMPVFGNTFGPGPVQPLSFVQSTHETWWDHSMTPVPPVPFGFKILIDDPLPSKDLGDIWFADPGPEMLANLDFTNPPNGIYLPFLNDYATYAIEVINVLKSEPNLVAWELFNEPDRFNPLNPPAYLGTCYLIDILRALVQILNPGKPIALGVGSPPTMELLNVGLSVFFPKPGGTGDYIKDYGFWFGFHAQNHALSVGSSGAVPWSGSVGQAGYPPLANAVPWQGLLNGPGGQPGSLTFAFNFLAAHGATNKGFIEESCLRGAYPQVLHDLDLACRTSLDPSARTMGLMYWTPTYSRYAVHTMVANGGPAFIEREALSLRDRYSFGGLGHADGEVNTAIGAFQSIHGAASFPQFVFSPPSTPTPRAGPSRSLRPLVIKSGATTLAIGSDPLDDVPVHSSYSQYPATGLPANRNRIWAVAMRTGKVTSVLDLDSTAINPDGLIGLSQDLRFREVDDNVDLSTGNPSPPPALPIRTSFFSPNRLDSWLAGVFINSSGQEVQRPYPHAQVVLDATWKFNGLVPTVAMVCGWSGYAQDLAALETELCVSGYLTGRARMSYGGVTGRVTGIPRPQVAAGRDRFLLAFHRAVRQDLYNPSENFGPEGDARDSTLTARLRDSANYGAFYRRSPISASDPRAPEKYEIVLVTVDAFLDGAQNLKLESTASVHGTTGADTTSGKTNPGASARDPVLATNSTGDVVLVYTRIQDPFFLFAMATEGSSGLTVPVNSHDPAGDQGNCTPTSNSPFPSFNAVNPLQNNWSTFVNDSRWNRYYGELVAQVWMTGTGGFSPPQKLDEPYSAGASFLDESWGTWHQDQKDLPEYGGAVYSHFGRSGSQTFKFLKNYNATQYPPHVDVNDPHAWYPVLSPQVQVGERLSLAPNETPIFVAWKQLPRDRRIDYQRPIVRTNLPWPTYAVYGLRLRGVSGVNSTVVVSGNAHQTFGSATGMTGVAGEPTLTTFDAPALTFQWLNVGSDPRAQDAAGARVLWQRELELYQQDEGQTALPAVPHGGFIGFSDQAGIRTPKAGFEPRRGHFSTSDTTLRLAAWLHPVGNAMDVRVQTEMATRSITSPIQSIGQQTTDPRARIVAVIPYLKPVDVGATRVAVGRVVWQADDDVWVADVSYDTGLVPHSVVRASAVVTGGKGVYPTLTTEVAAFGDTVLWTDEGELIAVRR